MKKVRAKIPPASNPRLSKEEQGVAGATARLQLSALYGPNSNETDHAILNFLIAWHELEGRKVERPFKFKQHPTLALSNWTKVRLRPLVESLVEALVNYDPKPLTRIIHALKRVASKASGAGADFDFRCAKPEMLYLIELARQVPRTAEDRKLCAGSKDIPYPDGLSAEDAYQELNRAYPSSGTQSERHIRRVLKDLGHEPKNKGGYRARRP